MKNYSEILNTILITVLYENKKDIMNNIFEELENLIVSNPDFFKLEENIMPLSLILNEFIGTDKNSQQNSILKSTDTKNYIKVLNILSMLDDTSLTILLNNINNYHPILFKDVVTNRQLYAEDLDKYLLELGVNCIYLKTKTNEFENKLFDILKATIKEKSSVDYSFSLNYNYNLTRRIFEPLMNKFTRFFFFLGTEFT